MSFVYLLAARRPMPLGDWRTQRTVVLSPQCSIEGELGFLVEPCDWYPGDSYVDILATNWYVSNSPDYNEVDDPTVGKFNRFYTDTIKNCGNKPYVIPEYGGDATYTITEHPLKKSLEIVEARIDRGAKVAYVGPYFYYDNDELGSELTPRVITLEQMSGYWSKAKR